MTQIKNISKIEKIAVHDGAFNTDDVFAVGALLYLNPNFQIIRTRNPKILEGVDMRIDVGMKYNPETGDYDHHQGAGERENGIPYAAFGLIWKDYGPQICDFIMEKVNLDKSIFNNNIPDVNSNDVAKTVDERLVQPIDLYDCNGHPKNLDKSKPIILLQEMINSSLARWHLDEDYSNNTQFIENTEFAKKKIKESILRTQGEILSSFVCQDAYEQSKKNGYDKIVVMNIRKMIPTQSLSETDALYCVQKGPNGDYSVKSIYKPGTFDSKKLMPVEWAGKKSEELSKITGVNDAVFCFKSFSASVRSLEGAIKLAELARDAKEN